SWERSKHMKAGRFVRLITWAFLFNVGSTALVWSQTAVATLDGAVTDESGAAVAGATVTAINRATDERKQTITTDTGSYRIAQLLPGFYDITAEMKGFRKTTATNVELLVQQTARVELSLKVGQVTQTVQVTGQTALLQTEEASVGNVIDQRRTVELP